MIQTMAVKITEKTYPIAAACLLPTFSTLPLSKVLGQYLVINELSAITVKGGDEYLVVDNSWMAEEVLNDLYTVCGEDIETNFVPVTRNK